KGSTSVTPQGDAWIGLEPPILVSDFSALAGEFRNRPPRLLRPRVLAESVRVVAVAEVRDVAYSPGDQAPGAVIADAAGNTLTLVRRHRAVAPFALEVLAAALSNADKPIRYISGDLRMGQSGVELDPIALMGERIVVPDLASSDQETAVALG